MGLIEFLLLATVAYLVWRISDQLPDLLFRISEIQRDVADIRKRLIEASESKTAVKSTARKSVAKSAAAKSAAANKGAAKKSAATPKDSTDTDAPSS